MAYSCHLGTDQVHLRWDHLSLHGLYAEFPDSPCRPLMLLSLPKVQKDTHHLRAPPSRADQMPDSPRGQCHDVRPDTLQFVQSFASSVQGHSPPCEQLTVVGRCHLHHHSNCAGTRRTALTSPVWSTHSRVTRSHGTAHLSARRQQHLSVQPWCDRSVKMQRLSREHLEALGSQPRSDTQWSKDQCSTARCAARPYSCSSQEIR